MKDDIIPPKKQKQEPDTSSLDEARDALLSAVESGAIREGYAEDGISGTTGFESTKRDDENNVGSAALSSTLDLEKASKNELMGDDSEDSDGSAHAPLVDISNIPTEKSRNQLSDEERERGNVRINESQNGKIRNLKLVKEKMPRTKKKSPIPKIIGFIILFILVAVIVAAIAGAIWYKSSLGAMKNCGDNDGCATEVQFKISSGETTEQIAKRLEEAKLIKSADAFRLYMKFEAGDKTLKSGEYTILDTSSVANIVRQLNSGAKEATRNIRFLPGDTIMSNRAVLIQAGYSEKDVDEALNASYDSTNYQGCSVNIFSGRPEGVSVEGFIYGETYNVYTRSSVAEILEKPFTKLCEVAAKNNLEADFKKQGLTLYQGIVLASVVQKESGRLVSDMPSVARVFINRLNSGTPLGSDAIIGYRADQINPDRNKQDMSYLTSIQCPWNSRRCAGLPPTPISSPSENALKAVANPDSHNYYYFLTGDDGKMHYATNEAEHNANIKNYCKKLCTYL